MASAFTINQVRYVFEERAKGYVFDSTKVLCNGNTITYDDGLVKISLYSRLTHHLGDTDVMTHEQVWINEALVHEDRYA